MTPQEKQELSEIDICDIFITPAIKEAGWDQLTQIRREVTLTLTSSWSAHHTAMSDTESPHPHPLSLTLTLTSPPPSP